MQRAYETNWMSTVGKNINEVECIAAERAEVKYAVARMLSLVCLNLLGALALRMMYRYAHKCGNQETTRGKILSTLLHMFSGIEAGNEKEVQKSKLQLLVRDVLA